MQLYQLIQDFKTQLQRIESDNTKIYEYAENKLNTLLDEKIEQARDELASELGNDMDARDQAILEGVKARAIELFTQHKESILQALSERIPTQEIQARVADAFMLQADLDLKESFKAFLQENAQDLSAAHKAELLDIITQKVREAVNAHSEAITKEVIKELDFSFLAKQPQVFYEVIINSMGELLTKKCENEYLQDYFKSMGRDIYEGIKDLEELARLEFEAQAHCVSMSLQNECKTLQESLLFLQYEDLERAKLEGLQERAKLEHELETQRLQNALILEQKRQELIAQGNLNDTLTTQSYKVV